MDLLNEAVENMDFNEAPAKRGGNHDELAQAKDSALYTSMRPPRNAGEIAAFGIVRRRRLADARCEHSPT